VSKIKLQIIFLILDLTLTNNQANFITLGKISEEDKIEIIKLGFQLQNEGKISLKKYSEEIAYFK
jgi:hypothetical protein